METRHHISDEMLFAYASGKTTAEFDVVLATHLTFCPACRTRLAQMEEVAGGLLEATKPVQYNDASLEAVLYMLEDEEDPETVDPRPVRPVPPEDAASPVPAPLVRLLPHDRLGDLPWQSLVPGVRRYPLKAEGDEGNKLELLRISPGTTIPQHSHSGAELTLILSGSYTDEFGRFQRGDIADLDEQISHQPIADSGEDCICLIAAEGQLKFKGLLPRLLQPFIGF